MFARDVIGDHEYSDKDMKQEDPEDDVKCSQFVLPILEGSSKNEVKNVVCAPTILEGSNNKHVPGSAGLSFLQLRCNGSKKCEKTFKLKIHLINHKEIIHPKLKKS